MILNRVLISMTICIEKAIITRVFLDLGIYDGLKCISLSNGG